ncbi:MAG: cupredoxin domain-containing protein [Actinomycetota bacterium]|nr:cupredoxin domain-containing protein [Actinomycetota bacterium]
MHVTEAATAPANQTGRHQRRRQSGRHTHHRVAAAAALATVGILATACSSSPARDAAAGSGRPTITISSFAYHPATLTVRPGAHVTVTNTDAVAHTLTSRSGAFNTGLIQPGQSVTIVAPTKDGTYPYYCTVHQFMTGTLVVSG